MVGNKNDLNREISKEDIIKYANNESLFYFEVSALKNDGVHKMIYSSISELPSFIDEGNDKNKIVHELEECNKPNLNISILSGVDFPNQKEEKNEAEKDKNGKIILKTNKKEKKKKCC